MSAYESIHARISELKRKLAQYQDCINHYQHCINVFSKAMTEQQTEIKELSELVDGAKALSICP